MSESSFPFGASDAPSADPAGEQAGSDRRKMLLAGGAVAAAVLGGGGYLLLGGGSGSDATPALPVVPVLAHHPAAASPRPSASPPAAAPAAFHEALGRDPFRALYVQAAPVTSSAPDPTMPSPIPSQARAADPALILAGGTPGTTPVPPAPADATGGPAGAPGRASSPPSAQEHTLVLRSVTATGDALVARFVIDGSGMSVRVGQVFGPAKEIKLISLQQGPKANQWTAVVQVGDADPFDVVSGEPVSVR